MELSRHAQVLWRFKVIIVAGVIAGLVLAAGTLFNVSSSGLEWREQLEYKSSSTLFVTQPGFPWGRANLPTAGDGGTPATATAPDQNFAEPARFAGLASIYSFLVRGEQVRELIPGRPGDDQIAAEPFVSSTNGNSDTLPLIGLVTTAKTPAAAQRLNADSITALKTYISRQQRASRTVPAQRAVIQVLNPPSAGTVAKGRSLTGAIVVFLLCVIGAVALAYVLENLRPIRPAEVAAAGEGDRATADGPGQPLGAEALDVAWTPRTDEASAPASTVAGRG
jgi:hypothetical protein